MLVSTQLPALLALLSAVQAIVRGRLGPVRGETPGRKEAAAGWNLDWGAGQDSGVRWPSQAGQTFNHRSNLASRPGGCAGWAPFNRARAVPCPAWNRGYFLQLL